MSNWDKRYCCLCALITAKTNRTIRRKGPLDYLKDRNGRQLTYEMLMTEVKQRAPIDGTSTEGINT